MVSYAHQRTTNGERSSRRELTLGVAGIAGVLASVTFNIGWLVGDHTQSPRFRPRHDDISDLGALTAHNAWLYNQVAANLTGILLVMLAAGLWLALRSNRLGRFGAATLAAAGIGMFLDGLFRLDCEGINSACNNQSWHAHAHKVESGFTVAFTLLSILLLALAFRKSSAWHDAWMSTLAGIPALFIANTAFSPLGPGAATRAGTVTVLATFAFIGTRLVARKTDICCATVQE